MYSEISSNKWKSILLFIGFFIFIGLLVFAINLIFFQGYIFIIFAAIIAVIFALISYYTGDKIVLAMSHAKEANKKDYAHLINSVEVLQ